VKKIPGILLVAALFCLSGFAAKAAVTYDYTGLDFTRVIGAYTTSDSVTGSFTLASPLGDNLSLSVITPVSFSFSDGVNTITSANASISLFEVNTDASGNMIYWNITLSLNGADISTADGLGDLAGFGGSSGGNHASGTMTLAATPVPEPGSWPLLLTGAGLLVALRFGARRQNERVLAAG
jgi:hypothetical protein